MGWLLGSSRNPSGSPVPGAVEAACFSGPRRLTSVQLPASLFELFGADAKSTADDTLQLLRVLSGGEDLEEPLPRSLFVL